MASVDQVINNANTVVKFVSVDDRTADPSTLTLLTLDGANTATIDYADTKVDISTFGDELIVPEAKVSVNATASIGGVVTDSAAFAAYEALANEKIATAIKECYMEITFGDGSKKAFYGLVGSYNVAAPQRDVLRFTSSVTVQSEITETAAP